MSVLGKRIDLFLACLLQSLDIKELELVFISHLNYYRKKYSDCLLFSQSVFVCKQHNSKNAELCLNNVLSNTNCSF